MDNITPYPSYYPAYPRFNKEDLRKGLIVSPVGDPENTAAFKVIEVEDEAAFLEVGPGNQTASIHYLNLTFTPITEARLEKAGFMQAGFQVIVGGETRSSTTFPFYRRDYILYDVGRHYFFGKKAAEGVEPTWLANVQYMHELQNAYLKDSNEELDVNLFNDSALQ